jgi:predicted ATPase
VEAEILYQRGVGEQARYFFKHALIQDTAYQSLLKSTRQQYHTQIAKVLEERFPDTKTNQPELLAHHYTEANLIEQAIPYWRQAGQRAAQRSAYVEAISHFTKGLELLQTLPDTPERAQQELTLQIALGTALVATKGYAALETTRAYARARQLCQQVGETPQLFPVLGGLAAFYIEQGEFQTAHKLAEQLLRIAQYARDPVLLLWAHLALGQTFYFLAELKLAREHFEQSLALYDRQQLRSYGYAYDPGVACRSRLARVLWSLGYPDQALKSSQAALSLAQGLSHPFSLALALSWAAEIHRFRREPRVTQQQAEALITLSTEQGFPYWLAMGTILQGWTLAEQGREAQAIAQIQEGMTAWRAVGSKPTRTWGLALLAEVYGKAGQTEERMKVLAEALATINRTGERYYEAELYRLKGELTLQKAGTRDWGLGAGSSSPQAPSLRPQVPSEMAREAEGYFFKAIEIAQKQQAKSWELRASTSLARLWQQQGKRAEAHKLLLDVYNWFTEGFDTKDLQEAKRLLEELNH